jgi:hypothetical protein
MKKEDDGLKALQEKYRQKQLGTGSPLEKPVDENKAHYEAKRKGSSFAQKGQAQHDENNTKYDRKAKAKYAGQE